jgi:anhydro-N-acetylmuramic acid kinase
VFIGLMSGTSLDGVDGVLAEFDGDAADAPVRTLAFETRPMPESLRAELLALQQSGPDELSRAALATVALTDLYAEVVGALVVHAGGTDRIMAIGAHGQTVRHRPELGYTLQLIDGARLAERSGCTTVVDLRSADVAAGGQGAPLVPAFHALAFASADRRRAVVNLGGIANVSLLPAGGCTWMQPGPGLCGSPGSVRVSTGSSRPTVSRSPPTNGSISPRNPRSSCSSPRMLRTRSALVAPIWRLPMLAFRDHAAQRPYL